MITALACSIDDYTFYYSVTVDYYKIAYYYT